MNVVFIIIFKRECVSSVDDFRFYFLFVHILAHSIDLYAFRASRLNQIEAINETEKIPR